MAFLIVLLGLAACGSGVASGGSAAKDSPGYLISGLDESGNFANNRLLIFDPPGFSTIKTLPLPRSGIQAAGLAPDGRLWIGLSGGSTWDDDRLLVLDQAGRQLAELHVCLYPTAGIWFYNHKALVVCRDTGFTGTLARIDTSSFSVEKKLTLQLTGRQSFMAVSSGLSGAYLGVIGLTTGPLQSLAYSMLAVVNLDTFSVTGMVPLGPGTNVWSVLPYQGDFYLLNAQGRDSPQRADLLVVDPADTAVVKPITLPTLSPLWGAIAGQTLYSFHDNAWNSTSMSPERYLCNTDLSTYQQACQRLPDGFSAFSLGLIDGMPCLAQWGNALPAGLACLENGKLNLKLEYKNASLIVMKK